MLFRSDATSTDERNLQLIASGQHQSVRRDTLAKIQAVAPQPMTARGMYVDSLASQRRVQSLCALGHSMLVIANAAGTTQKRIQLISSGRQASVRHHIAIRLLATYRELSEITPKPGRSSTRTRRGAAEKGWAPPAAWDDDSIDDPEAHPDWTGFCGTDRGWWTHRLERIPACERCQAAHDEWLQAHQGLSHGDRFKALGRAKAEASNRGAAIVENARELMRLGASYETAAQRLGITRQHLQQELIRHPEPAAAA